MTDLKWQLTAMVQPGQGGQSVRQLLEQSWLLPHRFVHYLRTRQTVTVNGSYRTMNQLVAEGDRVALGFYGDEFRTAESNYLPTMHPHLQVLFENRDLVIVNKPAGQKTHPNQPGEGGTLMNDVAGYLADQPNAAAYMVHRIDQATSGAVVVAKNPVVVPILDRQLAAQQMHRAYLAVVAGHFNLLQGRFDWPIGRDETDRRKRKVNGQGALPATSFYQVLATNATQSLVRLTLATGRTHQLRVHLAYSGHPIVGDPLYNPTPAPQMLLHGAWQRLPLPFNNKILQVQAPLPTYFPPDLVK